MTQATTRLALIGCGQWGQNWARNLAKAGVLHAVCDASPAALARMTTLYPGVRATSDVAAVLADPAVTACVIASPAAFHFELGRQALAAGKDVMIEKPLALTSAEGERLVALAAEAGRILMVGHLLEYHPAVQKLRELIAEGELGKICYIYSNRLNLGRIRTEENALWSFAPHDIHVITTLLHEQPEEVACQGASYLSHQVADVTMSTMRFASGVRGHIFVSWLHPYKEHKLIVVGDRQMAVFDDTATDGKLKLYPHRVDWVERIPIAVKAEATIVPLADAEPLAAECRHFLDSIATRQAPRTDGQNGVDVLRVLEMCQRSLESGGAPVRATVAPVEIKPAYYAHPTAFVDRGCEIGEGTKVWHFCHVSGGARIGEGSSLGQNVFVAKDVVIGNNVKIQNNVSLYEGVTLDDDVFCGPSMVFTNVVNPRSHVSRKHEYRTTRVGRGASIGANATIVCGHDVGAYAFIAAGAVVTKNVPEYALMIGTPARLAGWMCQCGIRMPFGVDRGGEQTHTCAECGTQYTRRGDSVVRSGQTVPSAEGV